MKDLETLKKEFLELSALAKEIKVEICLNPVERAKISDMDIIKNLVLLKMVKEDEVENVVAEVETEEGKSGAKKKPTKEK